MEELDGLTELSVWWEGTVPILMLSIAIICRLEVLERRR